MNNEMKYVVWITRILLIGSFYFSTVIPWLKPFAFFLMYISFVIYRKNYWFNIAYEIFLFAYTIIGFNFIDLFEHQWYIWLNMILIGIYLPLVIYQDKKGYPWFERNVV